MNVSTGEWFKTTLSSTLVNNFLELTLSDTLEEHDGKISICGRTISSLWFAANDDALAEKEQDLEA